MNPSALWLPGRFKPHTEITSSKLAFLPCAIEVVVVVLSRDFIKTREREVVDTTLGVRNHTRCRHRVCRLQLLCNEQLLPAFLFLTFFFILSFRLATEIPGSLSYILL